MRADVCLVLEDSWPTKVGGVARWVDSLVRGLPEISFAVAHLTAGPAPSPTFEIPPNVLDVTYIDVSREGVLPDPTLSQQIPDARVLHALSSGESGWLATWAARARGCPLILTEHGIAWREAAAGCGQLESGRDIEGDREDAAAALLRAARAAYARADIITTVNRDNVRLMTAAGAPSSLTRVISNWAEPQDARAVSSATSGLHVGYVGRVVELKDPLTFVRAAAIVHAADPDTRFSIVGPLDHSPGYARQVQDSVQRLGLSSVLSLVGQQDPDDWYPQFDVLVLTSRSEAEPLVLLEAMSRGIPVVATDVGGCRDLVGASEPAGLVVPQGDAEAVSDAIRLLCGSPPLRAELGANGRERVRRSHSRDAGLASYQSLYELTFDLVVGGRGPVVSV
jgi:glycosyltransferase involved in cell wall biosynthesis